MADTAQSQTTGDPAAPASLTERTTATTVPESFVAEARRPGEPDWPTAWTRLPQASEEPVTVLARARGNRTDEPEEPDEGGWRGTVSRLAHAADPGRRGLALLLGVFVAAVLLTALVLWLQRPDATAVTGAPPVAAGPDSTTAAPGSSGSGEREPLGSAAPVPPPGDPGPRTAAPSGPSAPPPGSAESSLVVSVVGEVHAPGIVHVVSGARVADAIEAAGGVTDEADLTSVNLAQLVADGEQVVLAPVPADGTPLALRGTSSAGASVPGGGAGPVNLNSAAASELQTLPGVGPVLAGRIVDWREAYGPFTQVEDLQEVSGIGAARFEELRDLVAV